MKRLSVIAALTLVTMGGVALAQEASEEDAFVEANILAIFYHELGHAVIDLMEVPIFGQEEDAADVMSVLLIDWLFEEDSAQAIAYDSAFGFLNDPEGTEDVEYWGVHGPDEQRFYNHVCLFYGANPDVRDDLADDLGLPEERADSCPEEYEQAADSWSAIFDAMAAQATGVPMVFLPGYGPDAEIINPILQSEVADMNADMRLPQKLTVIVDSCDEANAFYGPQEVSVTFCTEFVPHLRELFALFTDE